MTGEREVPREGEPPEPPPKETPEESPFEAPDLDTIQESDDPERDR